MLGMIRENYLQPEGGWLQARIRYAICQRRCFCLEAISVLMTSSTGMVGQRAIETGGYQYRVAALCCADVTPPINFCAGRDVVAVLTKCRTQNLSRDGVRLLA